MVPAFKGRREDGRLVTGRGRYTDDWDLPGQLYAAFKRSDRAHALIRSLDIRVAERVPGVVAVIAGRDTADTGFRTLPPIAPLVGRDGKKLLVPDRPLLPRDRVRFVGEEVAMVVAQTREAAKDAADLVEVEYDDLPAIIGFEKGLAAEACVHSNIPNNICFDFEYGDAARTTELIGLADHAVRLTMESPRVAPTPMEPRGALAWYDAGRDAYEIRCAHQGAFAMRDALAAMMDAAPEKLRVNMVDVGGAFGARTAPFSEYPLMLYMAKKLGRPIKWLSTRSEDFLTDNHGRAIRLEGELAFSSRGRLIALRTDWLCDCGAYLSQAGAFTNCFNGLTIGAGAYQVEALYGRHRLVITNTSPTNAYRGAGRPEAIYVVERLVDAAAHALGLDPLELRRRNVIRPDQMPYRTLTGTVFDSCDFPGLVAKIQASSSWPRFPRRRKEATRRGALRGIGCALFLEPSGGGLVPKDQVAIRFGPNNEVALYSVAGPSGQGHETVFAELIAQTLGLDPKQIVLRAGDPDGPALIGSPAIGSRTILSHGSAYRVAAEQVIEKARSLAAEALEASGEDVEYADGRYRIKGTDRAITFAEIIQQCASQSPHPLDTIAEMPITRAFPSGAHVAEVEIDRETGCVSVVDYTAVDDIGNVVNHTLADGQLHGGIVQGAGQVFGESCLYDIENGQLLAGSFMDYTMPRADLMPGIRTLDHAVPSPGNLLGAKGAGEAGTTGAGAACMNAVLDALRSAGVDHFDMPATPARIWSALQAGECRSERTPAQDGSAGTRSMRSGGRTGQG
ncbi:MAG TPA: xanthine dehydrogenase family protein molybdopterin-binding subunit [Xanthobacteraceae bacterium]|jgi:carbon-monoxide dehydrogenase large subunit